jgi:CRP-like cAMP-binding protein
MVTLESARTNRILALLPQAYLQTLLQDFEVHDVPRRDVLEPRGRQPEYAYFILHGVASTVSMDGAGNLIEVATVGYEGMVGLSLFLGAPNPALEVFMQVPGSALRMPAALFRAHAEHPELSRAMKRYTQALLTQVSQASACNRIHPVEERCARWLLQTHDRVRHDVFDLTQEFLAMMLAVRRASVSEVANALQAAGLIYYHRGCITVLDRKGLERKACNCYAMITEEYNRLLGGPSL